MSRGRSGGRVRRSGHPNPRPSEPDVRVSTHTAQAFTNAPRGTRRIPSTLRTIVNLSMAVRVQQLQVVHAIRAAMTTSQTMVNVPFLLRHFTWVNHTPNCSAPDRVAAGSRRVGSRSRNRRVFLRGYRCPPGFARGRYQPRTLRKQTADGTAGNVKVHPCHQALQIIQMRRIARAFGSARPPYSSGGSSANDSVW